MHPASGTIGNLGLWAKAYSPEDFPISPMLFYYEVTQACDLVCKHCRASAQPDPHPDELPTELARALLEQVASFPRPPSVVLTGGDPLKRADLFELIEHGSSLGLEIALTPSVTPLGHSGGSCPGQGSGCASPGD